MIRRALPLLCLFLTFIVGCDSKSEESRLLGSAIPEPAAGLRPEPARGVVPEQARIADYELEARLDAEKHTLTGNARVEWRNTGEQAVDTVPFHLYMNGFRAEDTDWMRSSGGEHRRSKVGKEGAWGYIDVHSVRMEPRGSSELVAPSAGLEEPPGGMLDLEWSEDADPSLMTVRLPRAVEPGESVRLDVAFTTQLPKVVARTGWGGKEKDDEDFHAVAQWYPKIAVLDEDGWNAHTFTVNDEFYADFGNYSVTLDVPEDHIVGASGVRTSETVEGGRKRLTYEAEMVHDFAWMSDPNFVEHFADYNGIRIRQLIQPEFVDDADDHMEAQIAALKTYEARFGTYPWSTITIVHVPKKAQGAGGMEYPTLYTTSDMVQIAPWMRYAVFDERVSGINTTVHEFGHQYFQGLFASREHEQPWLDEGINTFSNSLALIDRTGEEDPWLAKFFGHALHSSDLSRAAMMRGSIQAVDRSARAFDQVIGVFGLTVYQKTASLMLTLRNLAGAEAFDRGMRLYAERARFGHPRGVDLEAALSEEIGERFVLGASRSGEDVEVDVAEYLEQALRTTREIDFHLLQVRNQRRMGEAGWRRDESGELVGGKSPKNLDKKIAKLDDDKVTGVVAIQRKGDFLIPVEVAVEFADGTEERFVWDAREPTVVYDWPGRRVRRAILDPEGKLYLEGSRLDNVAWARDLEEEDGLSASVGRMFESIALAAMGGIGP